MTREKSYDQTQEDILRERAQVLARAGESVHMALEKLKILEQEINDKTDLYRRAEARCSSRDPVRPRLHRFLERLLEEIDLGVAGYNEERGYAKVRYYYPVSYTHLTLPTKRIV